MKGKVLDVRESDWVTNASITDQIFIGGLLEIGFNPDESNRFLEVLCDAKRKANAEKLIAKWNDSRYRTQDNFEKKHSIGQRSRPTARELREFEASLLHVHHKTDADYAIRYLNDISERIKEILGIVKVIVEDEKYDELKVPMFYLHSPMIKHSEVSYQETHSKELSNIYEIGILGTALGATKSITFSSSASVKSINGQCKMLYMIAKVKHTLLSITKGGKSIKTLVRTELDRLNKGNEITIGVDSIPKDILFNLNNCEANKRSCFSLSGDFSNDVLTYKECWEKSEKMDVKLGVDVFKVQSVIKGELKRDIELKLEYKLPAGYDYAVRRICNGFGILWDTK